MGKSFKTKPLVLWLVLNLGIAILMAADQGACHNLLRREGARYCYCACPRRARRDVESGIWTVEQDLLRRACQSLPVPGGVST